MDDIKVSIICNTYNHEKYIREALNGFVMQKTDFTFEILVHDDASTDGTADIIREYEKKYPELIRPIYQTENQYSKGVLITKTIQEPRAKGEYIALCEGDDCWIDPYKLQKQIDLLDRYPEVNICATSAKIVSNTKWQGFIASSKEVKVFPLGDVIKGGGSFVPTPSLVYRSVLVNNKPSFYSVLGNDYALQILGSLKSGMLYLPEETVLYRYRTAGSWTKRASSNNKYRITHSLTVCKMLQSLDEYTDFQYHDVINNKCRNIRFDILIAEGSFSDVLDEYRDIYKERSLQQRLYVRIGAISPKVIQLLK